MENINNKSLIVLFSLVLLFCTAVTSSAVDQVLIQSGFSNETETEPDLWYIMNLMTEPGDPTITEAWVNANQTGQLWWHGDYARVTMMANYALTDEDLNWGDSTFEGDILTATTNGIFNTDILFHPDGDPWYFINRSDNGNWIGAYGMQDNIVSFEFEDYYIVAFEDWDLEDEEIVSDKDYQDLVIKFQIVPEPLSSTLFIIGGAALGFRGFRKKRR